MTGHKHVPVCEESATSMFFDSVTLFSLAMASVISTAWDFLFCDRSHLGDSGMNLQIWNNPGITLVMGHVT